MLYTCSLQYCMARNHTLLQMRNAYIKQRFRFHATKNPNYRSEVIIRMVSQEVFLSEVTVCKILNYENVSGVPNHSTLARKIN